MIRLDAKNASLGLSGGCPRLLSFPVGVPPNAEEMELNLSHKSSGRGKRKRQVETSLDGLTYRGCDYGEFSSGNNSLQYAIARLDESTGIMTIVPADHAFIMRPELERNQIPKPPRLSSLSTVERREMRTDEFGSRKKQRAQQVAASNVISAQNISGADAVESAMLNNVSDDAKVNNATEMAISGNRELYLPKFNQSAKDVADVYPLHSLISDDVDAALEEYTEQIYANLAEQHAASFGGGDKKIKKQKTSQLAESFCKHMQTREAAAECVLKGLGKIRESALSAVTAESGDGDKVARKRFKKGSRRAVMLHFMIRFYQVVSASVSKFKPDAYKSEIIDKIRAPHVISSYLLANFTSASTFKGKVSFSKIDNDKLRIHMIAVALHIGQFSCSLSVIARDLKLVDKTLADLAHQMGCKVIKDKESARELVATLSAPLVFPATKKAIKK